MIDLKPVITVSAVMLLLNACDNVDDSNFVEFSEISVAAHSGIDAGLDGTYTTGCYLGGSGTVNEDLRILGNTWNYTINDFTSIDCTTAPTAGTISGTFVIDGADTDTTGWVDDSGIGANAPLAAIDDGSFLDPIETITPLLITISGATGSLSATSGTTSFFYVVDDTGADNILYRDREFDAGAAVVASIFAPYRDTNVNSTEVLVAAHSGTDASLNGTYSTGCYLGGAGSNNEDLVILGNKWDYTKTEYTSLDCSTGATVGTISGTFKIDGTVISTIGWVDSAGGIATAPLAAIGDGSFLSDPETVTPLLLTIYNATGSLFGNSGTSSFFFVVDDTGANNVLYRDSNYDGGATTADNFNSYIKQ